MIKYLVLIILILSSELTQGKSIELRLFGSSGCEQCERVEHGVIRDVQELYPDIAITKILTDNVEGFKKLLQLEALYGDDRNESVKAFVGDFNAKTQGSKGTVICLSGVDEIEAQLIQTISNFEQGKELATLSVRNANAISNSEVKSKELTTKVTKNTKGLFEKNLESSGILVEKEDDKSLTKEKDSVVFMPSVSKKENKTSEELAQKRVERFTIGAVITAGFLDGVNPCVFSTLVFFIGLLVASQVKGRRLLIIGLSFCFGSFVMYTTMGFGILSLLHSLWYFKIIQSTIKWLMVSTMGYFAIITFCDAYQLRKQGTIAWETCSLPVGIIGKIHRAIQSGINTKYLIPSAFGAGVMVTAFESICTGQVYVPTLVLIIKSGVSQLTGWVYLLLFNIACITPLLLIFICVYNGINLSKFEQWATKNALISKLLLAIFFSFIAFELLP